MTNEFKAIYMKTHKDSPQPKTANTLKSTLTENSGPVALDNLDAVAAQSLQQAGEEAAAGEHLLAELHREVLVLLGDSAADRERASHRHQEEQLQL